MVGETWLSVGLRSAATVGGGRDGGGEVVDWYNNQPNPQQEQDYAISYGETIQRRYRQQQQHDNITREGRELFVGLEDSSD